MQIPLRLSFNSENEKAWTEALPLLINLMKDGTALRISKDVANDIVVEFTVNPELISFGESEECI